MTVSLYSITNDYLRALNELTQIDDIPDDAIRDTLEGMDGEWLSKAEAVAAYILNLDSEANLQDQAGKRMIQRAKATSAKAERLRNYLMREMKLLGKDEISTAEFAAKIKKNPEKVVVADDDAVPDEFCNIQHIKKPDKKAIKYYLEESRERVNWASIERSERLEIK